MEIKTKKNYYNILGVTPDSEAAEVKAAYRSLARKYHPDINKAPESAQKFKDILEAYETLSDTTRRKQYDMVNGFYKTPKNSFAGNNFKKASQENSKTTFKQTSNNQNKKNKTQNNQNTTKSNTTTQDEIYRQKFFKNRINSILDEIIKNHNHQNKKNKPQNGDDIKTDITISLSESIKGTERVLNIIHKELCPHCRGRKFINGTKCQICSGSGVFNSTRKITVKIPAGIKNNSKLRLAGEGNPGFWGGENGNIYITVKIKQNSNIEIHDNNILVKLPITPFEAVLGGSVPISVLDKKLTLTLPPMTNSGQKFRIANQGLKTNEKFGDIIVTVEIQLPKNLSQDEIRMYEKLKKMSSGSIRENITNE